MDEVVATGMGNKKTMPPEGEVRVEGYNNNHWEWRNFQGADGPVATAAQGNPQSASSGN